MTTEKTWTAITVLNAEQKGQEGKQFLSMKIADATGENEKDATCPPWARHLYPALAGAANSGDPVKAVLAQNGKYLNVLHVEGVLDPEGYAPNTAGQGGGGGAGQAGRDPALVRAKALESSALLMGQLGVPPARWHDLLVRLEQYAFRGTLFGWDANAQEFVEIPRGRNA